MWNIGLSEETLKQLVKLQAEMTQLENSLKEILSRLPQITLPDNLRLPR